MKTRTGFVSNSSSSSFIIAVGLVTDKVTFLSDNPILPRDISVYTVGELKEAVTNNNNRVYAKINSLFDANGKLSSLRVSQSSFDDTEVYSVELIDCHDEELVIVYDGGYSMSEDDFYTYDENGEIEDYDCNYDVDISQFSQEEQNIVQIFESSTVDHDVAYGAGRNG